LRQELPERSIVEELRTLTDRMINSQTDMLTDNKLTNQ